METTRPARPSLPASWRPSQWQQRFITSVETSIVLEGHEHCGKQRCLIESAAVGAEHPDWRACIITIGPDAKVALIQAAEGVYGRLAAIYSGEFCEWRFISGATVRLAGSIQEARASIGYDMLCLEHLEEFRYSEIVAVLSQHSGLLRRGGTRRPRVRATFRIERDWRKKFVNRIMFDVGDDLNLFDDPSPDTTDLERLVLALTKYRFKLKTAAVWEEVLDAARTISDGPHDDETIELARVVELKNADEQRLTKAFERARHRLAEKQGAPPGACHMTCPSDCQLGARRREMSADVAIQPQQVDKE